MAIGTLDVSVTQGDSRVPRGSDVAVPRDSGDPGWQKQPQEPGQWQGGSGDM